MAYCILCLGYLLSAEGIANSCQKNNANRLHVNDHHAQTVKSGEKELLALGDSYTIGQSVNENERFPWLTVSALKNKGIVFGRPSYIAATGWTTIDLQSAIEKQKPVGPYDIVTLLVGVNDQYQGLDTSGYRIRFTELLDTAISLAGGDPSGVFVLSIPDYSTTPFVPEPQKARVSREVDVFNRINKETTFLLQARYLDITPLTREAAADSSLLAGDHLHYSAKEHRKWAERLAILIEQHLTSSHQ